MKFYEKTISKKLIYSGNYLKISNIEVELPNGKITTRDIINHPGACAIIPFIDDNTILLIEQFRKPLNKTILEIPAGKLSENESILDCAHRELEEETGYVSDHWKHIYTIPSNPTIADNYAYLYYADDCEKVSNQHLDSTEFLEVKEYTEDEINDLIKNNEFVQPIHLMGWLMVKKGVL